MISGLAFPQEIFNWEEINSPTSQVLNTIYFINKDTGWVGGADGIIINTTDGGENWSTIYQADTTYILDIFFLNYFYGWAIFWDANPPYFPKMLKTTNGGDDWTSEVCPGESPFFRTVYFLDTLSGFLAGPPIIKTTDGGATWFETNTSDVDTLPPDVSGYPTKKLVFFNEQTGYACGGVIDLAGVMWWTSDGGENWLAKGMGPDPINDFYIFDSLTVLGLAGDPEGLFGIGHVKTQDGGMNWAFNELSIGGVAGAMSFRTPAEGWAVTGSKFIISVDSGTVWTEIATPGNVYLNDLTFIDSLTGYAVGYDGIILKYVPVISGGSETVSSDLPDEFYLHQNYPNPFNPTTEIKFALAKESNVNLSIYSVLGELVTTLVNGQLKAGYYEYEFNASKYSSGVYLYRLQAGDPSTSSGQVFIETKKMLLMK